MHGEEEHKDMMKMIQEGAFGFGTGPIALINEIKDEGVSGISSFRSNMSKKKGSIISEAPVKFSLRHQDE